MSDNILKIFKKKNVGYIIGIINNNQIYLKDNLEWLRANVLKKLTILQTMHCVSCNFDWANWTVYPRLFFLKIRRTCCLPQQLVILFRSGIGFKIGGGGWGWGKGTCGGKMLREQLKKMYQKLIDFYLFWFWFEGENEKLALWFPNEGAPLWQRCFK